MRLILALCLIEAVSDIGLLWSMLRLLGIGSGIRLTDKRVFHCVDTSYWQRYMQVEPIEVTSGFAVLEEDLN